jgi:chorismate mutase
MKLRRMTDLAKEEKSGIRRSARLLLCAQNGYARDRHAMALLKDRLSIHEAAADRKQLSGLHAVQPAQKQAPILQAEVFDCTEVDSLWATAKTRLDDHYFP